MLQDQVEILLQELKPGCIVSDMTYPWKVESAAKLNSPRIYYYSSSYFSNCASYFVRKYRLNKHWFSVDFMKFFYFVIT
jgi:hypothetical protein